jgi:hypothetical protein
MTNSAYSRGRSFTEPSTSRWVLREGGNNRWWQLPRKEAMKATRYGSEKLIQEPEALMPESILQANELFDSLETTRDLSSFSNTADAVDPEGGDVVISTNTTESEDGEFDNFNGLKEGDTF